MIGNFHVYEKNYTENYPRNKYFRFKKTLKSLRSNKKYQVKEGKKTSLL